MEILKDDTTVSLYGKRAKDGLNRTATKPYNRFVSGTIVIKGNDKLKNALVLVDGVEKTRAEYQSLSTSDIASVAVFESDVATKLYGDKGKNGLIKVTTIYAKK